LRKIEKGVVMIKKLKFLLLLTFLSLNVITLCVSFAQADYKPNMQNIKIKTIEYLNRLRELNGLNEVTENAKAMKVAQTRAEFQSNNTLTHNRLQEDLKKIKDPIYGTENLAYLYPKQYNSDDEVAKALINMWYDDEGIPNKGHHKQMLNPIYDFTGVGIKQDKNGYIYVSQVLASSADVSPAKITKELNNLINSFYEYFNSNELKEDVPLD
jgi:uncharacterized protein YkwD